MGRDCREGQLRRTTATLTILIVSTLAILTLTACRSSNDTPKDATTSAKVAEQEQAADESTRGPVIDVHTHIQPDAYEQTFALADRVGVQRIVNLSGGNQSSDAAMKLHIDAMRKWPGRLAVFYNLAWRFYAAPDFVDVMVRGLERAVSQGYAGLKIPKVLGLGLPDKDGGFVAVDDPRLDPIWAKAGELGIPVSIHTGDPKAFFEPLTKDNERYAELSEAPDWSFADEKYPRRHELLAQRDRLLKKHPKTTFILVHFGNNPEDIDYVAKVLDTHPNANVDISARIGEIGRHDPDRVRSLFVRHKRRILFGTDMGVHIRRRENPGTVGLFLGSLSIEPPTPKDVEPFYDKHYAWLEADFAKTGTIEHPIPIQGEWKVKPIHLDEETLKAIYHDNAMRLVFAPMFARLGVADPLDSKGPGKP